MPIKTKLVNSIHSILSQARNEGLLYLYANGGKLKQQKIKIKEKELLSFGSCSYLGLEFDKEAIASAKKALDDFGTQFSSSRTYLSIQPYEELENYFSKIFNRSCLLTPTTTLGHISAIPVVVEDGDAVIIDHQVHNSVQMAVDMLEGRAVDVFLAKHNDMAFLAEKLNEIKGRYNKVWYMADGIYSMYGTACKIEELLQFQEQYDNLYLYIDDSHSTGCFGANGEGYILNKTGKNNRLIVALGLAKGFASGGCVFCFPSEEMKEKVRVCGGPMITSGPVQPSVIGASMAIAKKIGNGEILPKQKKLKENIAFANQIIAQTNLPLLEANEAPIFFIGTGKPVIAQEIAKRMMKDGFYVNISIFPAVPIKQAGIRFTLTALHQKEDILNMLKQLDKHFNEVIQEMDYPLSIIHNLFGLTDKQAESQKNSNTLLKAEWSDTVTVFDPKEWDIFFVNKSMLDYSSLKMFETVFTNNIEPENNWEFKYLKVTDKNDKIIYLGVYTISIQKDDLLSPPEVSKAIEEKRTQQPYYLTSKTFMLGTPLTEGVQYYIDEHYKENEAVWKLIVNEIEQVKNKYNIKNTIIRDIPVENMFLNNFLQKEGYFSYEMPTAYEMKNYNWNNEQELIDTLTKRSKKHFKEDVRSRKKYFDVAIVKKANEELIEEIYGLYNNVKNKSLKINTFTLPKKLIQHINNNPAWEFIVLKLNQLTPFNHKLVAVGFVNYNGTIQNCPVLGINYDFQKKYKCYQQLIYQTVLQAKIKGCKKSNWGFTADTEKKKFGATPIQYHCYIDNNDMFNLQFVETIKTKSTLN